MTESEISTARSGPDGMVAGPRLVITGAAGYIGAALAAAARRDGWRVVALGRSPDPTVPSHPWRLGEDPPAEALAGADAVIHLAHQWAAPGAQGEDPNIPGTERLLEATRRHGVRRVVFASSISAREDALNAYGRLKWRVEQTLRAPVELSARIGLVYGGADAGLWGLLCKLVRLTPILPMVGGGRPIQPIRMDELCDGLLRLARMPAPTRAVYGLASPTTISFSAFLRTVARLRFHRPLMVISLPLGPVLAAVDLVSRVVPAINRERVLGLAGLPVIDNAADIAELGLEIRSVVDGLAPFARRKAILREGRALLRYVLGVSPPMGMLRHYVTGIESYGGGRPLDLPAPLLTVPGLLRLAEPVGGKGEGRHTLVERLEMAMILAESQPVGARRLYDYGGTPRWKSVLGLVGIGAIEALLLPVRMVLGRRYR